MTRLEAVLAMLMLSSWSGTTLAKTPPAVQQPEASAEATDTVPREGIACALVFFALAEEVGSRCFPGQDQELQRELHQSVARIDQFVLKNSDLTAEGLAKFKKEQAHVGAPQSVLCQSDFLAIYKGFRTQGAAAIHSATKKLVSRPGKPTLGTCT